jgi:8-oxo-dGTP pyrophosphatase MutT (NUDIX family)
MHTIVAVYCYQGKGIEHKIIIITSTTGRWIIPKGQTEEDRTNKEVALAEAWEEAGIRGEISGKSKVFLIDRGRISKWKIYPVKINEIAEKWPEKKYRKRRLLSPEEAAAKIDNPDLAKALLKLARKYQTN